MVREVRLFLMVLLASSLFFVLIQVRPATASESASVYMYVDPVVSGDKLDVNSSFSVSIRLDSIANHIGIVGAQFNLNWNAALLDPINITEVMFHEVTPVDSWDNIFTVFRSLNKTGGYARYGITWYDVMAAITSGYAPIYGNHTLATVEFRVKEKGICPLNLTNYIVGDAEAIAIGCSVKDGLYKNPTPIDLNTDGVVDIADAIILANAYGSWPGEDNWNEAADLNDDDFIDIVDAILMCNNFTEQ